LASQWVVTGDRRVGGADCRKVADQIILAGYIDLSKRRVSAEDVIKCEERYNKSKAVHSIMRHVAEKTGVEMDLVNDLVAWPLYKKYGHAYEAFKLSITYVAPPPSPRTRISHCTTSTENQHPCLKASPSPPTLRTNSKSTSRVDSHPSP
jgi:hypothetical protein